ncbi:MAG: hypothetical protein M1341_02500, partial [Candidatus Thermoplasmatota archaeon]|nr:hypothetical protein [Candidatus Thermoplasmatota archaeon]
DLDSLIRLSPSNTFYLKKRIETLIKMKSRRDAEKTLELALEMSPGDGELRDLQVRVAGI